MKLKAKIRRKCWPDPTMEKVMDPYIAENVLNQNFKADSPNQKWKLSTSTLSPRWQKLKK
jgi:putative transposase